MEEMEHSLERDKPETEITDSTIPNLETIHLAESASPKKSQHADDIALTQCILCMVLVLSVFALHWLKPDWQAFSWRSTLPNGMRRLWRGWMNCCVQYSSGSPAHDSLALGKHHIYSGIQFFCRGCGCGTVGRRQVCAVAVSRRTVP